MWEFIEQYFINPVYTGEGYNIFNTVVYVMFFVVGMYAVKWGLKNWKVKIDKKFFYVLLPFFVFAGLLRSLQDFWSVKHWLFITPGIYLLLIAIVGGILLFTKRDLELTRKIGWILAGITGGLVVAAAYTTAFNVQWLIAILGTAVLLTGLMWKLFPKLLHSRENKLVVFAQVLDGSASVIPIAFLGYGEQHVVSAWVMGGSPFVFLFVKIALVLGALYVIEKHKSEWDWLLKIAIVLLGLAPGTRDLARVFIGV